MTKLSAWKKVSAILGFFAATAIAVPAQTFTTLVEFTGYVNTGIYPYYVSLVQGIDGNFYGTTTEGGYEISQNCGDGCGVVFEVTPEGKLATTYIFCETQEDYCPDGFNPEAGLVLATDGSFYGTTTYGGQNNLSGGTAFKITPSGALTTLYDFCGNGYGCAGPSFPQAPLVQGTDGNFYGTSPQGGHHAPCRLQGNGCGTVFQMTPVGAVPEFYRFCAKESCPDGASPRGGLVLGTDGAFYGTTFADGAHNAGTVFKITPDGRFFTLYSFCSQTNCSDGANPWAGLIQAADGNLYGTTVSSGDGSCGGDDFCNGTIFKITPAGALTTLYTFCSQPNCADGSVPYGGLIQATDGNFYGTTTAGGNDDSGCYFYLLGCGTVFQVTPGGTLTILHAFSVTDGANPYAGLLQSTNGKLYGTTTYGGNSNCTNGEVGCGTIYSLDMGLSPFVAFVRNPAEVGQDFGILGQGFTGSTGVSLNGVPASFTVKSDTFIKATVPQGATTGYVTVTTPSGTLTSNVPFRVIR